jgi:hypothetical protein
LFIYGFYQGIAHANHMVVFYQWVTHPGLLSLKKTPKWFPPTLEDVKQKIHKVNSKNLNGSHFTFTFCQGMCSLLVQGPRYIHVLISLKFFFIGHLQFYILNISGTFPELYPAPSLFCTSAL